MKHREEGWVDKGDDGEEEEGGIRGCKVEKE